MKKEVRYLVKRRDKVCQDCRTRGSKGNPLTIHHIMPRSKYPKLVNDPDNLVLLCRRCHDIRHGIHRGVDKKVNKKRSKRYWIKEMGG